MKIAFSETTEYQLVHPVTDEPLVNSKGLPMVAVLHGKHTAAYKNIIAELHKRELKRNQKKAYTVEESKERGTDILEACVESFKNLEIETENGPLDPKNIRGILSDVFWIREQIDSAIVDIEAFSQKPNKT